MCMCVFPAYMFMYHVYPVFAEARGEHQIPWTWIYRWF